MVSTCPPNWFYILEFMIILCLIGETGIRMVAMPTTFWKDIFNILDFIVLVFCIICFIIIMTTLCSVETSREAIFEEVMLIIRNVVQLIRLGIMMKRSRILIRNSSQLSTRPRNIDFNSVSGAQLLPIHQDYIPLDDVEGII